MAARLRAGDRRQRQHRRVQDYLRGLEAARAARVIYLDENIGGEELNIRGGGGAAEGELVHFSENDQIFLPGWREHVDAAFAAFPDLGQLSLFSDTPTDDEAWEQKPSRLRVARGKILYEAPNNIGTSSILRGTIMRDCGVRVANVAGIRIKLPDDGKLSRDVRAAGYWCGFSDRYYVRNVGHEPEEFDRDPAYYEENYANKPLTGVAGWRAPDRAAGEAGPGPAASRSRFPSASRYFRADAASGQRPAGAVVVDVRRSHTEESEVLDLILVLTRLVKPAHVIRNGHAGSACRPARSRGGSSPTGSGI